MADSPVAFRPVRFRVRTILSPSAPGAGPGVSHSGCMCCCRVGRETPTLGGRRPRTPYASEPRAVDHGAASARRTLRRYLSRRGGARRDAASDSRSTAGTASPWTRNCFMTSFGKTAHEQHTQARSGARLLRPLVHPRVRWRHGAALVSARPRCSDRIAYKPVSMVVLLSTVWRIAARAAHRGLQEGYGPRLGLAAVGDASHRASDRSALAGRPRCGQSALATRLGVEPTRRRRGVNGTTCVRQRGIRNKGAMCAGARGWRRHLLARRSGDRRRPGDLSVRRRLGWPLYRRHH